MSTETDRILCSIAMWVLAICIWLIPQDPQSITQSQQNMLKVQVQKVASHTLSEGQNGPMFELHRFRFYKNF